LFHVAVYGADVFVAIRVLPAKNSTCATLPSASDAFALSEIVAGAAYVAPLAGDVNETAGGVFPGAPLIDTLSIVAVVNTLVL
jgi:hypothetical protein